MSNERGGIGGLLSGLTLWCLPSGGIGGLCFSLRMSLLIGGLSSLKSLGAGGRFISFANAEPVIIITPVTTTAVKTFFIVISLLSWLLSTISALLLSAHGDDEAEAVEAVAEAVPA